MIEKKKAHGLKMIFSAIKKRFRIICTGNPVKKIDYLSSCWENVVSANGDSLLEKEQNFLNQYKSQYELERLKQTKKNYEINSDVWPQDIQESGIRKIEIGVLEWFKAAWLKDETVEKIRFYLWMEADYFEHFEQYIHNKNAYFKGSSIQNKYEARTVGAEWMLALLGCIITFFVGKNADKIFQFLNNSDIFRGVYRWLAIGGVVLLVVLFLFFLYCGFNTLFHAEYTKKDNKLRKQKETWIRHVEAIASYQKEMIGFLWDLEDYQNCITQEEKEEVFMNNILNAWMSDNKKFQSNMAKQEEEKNVQDKSTESKKGKD